MRTRLLRGNTEANNRALLPAGTLTVNIDDFTLRIHDGVTPGGFQVATKSNFDFGPGPRVLQGGTMNSGFFGTLDSSDFINGETLAAAIGLSSGNKQNTDSRWLKFIHKGKILFVPMLTFRNTVTWDAIYLAGAVYGVDGVGPFAATGGVTADQGSRVVIGEDAFRVRLLTGAVENPSTVSGGEWNDLMVPIWTGDPQKRNWAAFTDGDLNYSGFGLNSFTQENTAAGTSSRVVRRGDVFSSYAQTATANGLGWRPCLELIPNDQFLFDPVGLMSNSETMMEVGLVDYSVDGSVVTINTINYDYASGLYPPGLVDYTVS
jgi:hypothetical protein